MDYVKEAENYLRHYASLKKSVEHAQYMIERLTYKSRPRKVGVVQNDVTGVAAQCPGNTLQEMYELQKWQEFLCNTRSEMDHIEKVFSGLDQNERKPLELWYSKKMDKMDIAAGMGYSHRQSVYELRDKALRNFSVALFGINALKAM